MRHIDFLITNPNHHLQLALPVIRELQKEDGISVCVLSLCEFRRMATPVEELKAHGIPYRILPGFRRLGLKPSSGRQSLGASNSNKRKLARQLAWQLYLQRPFLRATRHTGEVVLLNDSAYPGNHIAEALRRRNIPFYLMQEGIRFPLPNETADNSYGANGAGLVLAWGEHSRRHFEKIQPPGARTRVIAAGCPRYDRIGEKDYAPEMERLRAAHAFAPYNLGLFSNPIDDQGFCTPAEKMGLVEGFIQKALPMLAARQGKLWIKLHPREDVASFRQLIGANGWEKQVELLSGGLFAILKLMDAAVVMASTVGLEALLMGRPLGVLKLPRHGFVFDYVSGGGACALDPCAQDFGALFQEFTQQSGLSPEAAAYLSRHFSNPGNAGAAISRIIINAPQLVSQNA